MKVQILIRLIFFLLLLFSNQIYGENINEIDSLVLELEKESNDSLKVDLLLELASKTSWTDFNAFENYSRQALTLSQKINYLRGLAYSNYWMAKVFSEYEMDLSEKLIINSLKYAEIIKDSILIGQAYQVFGNLKYNVDLYDDAKMYYNKSLEIYLRYNEFSKAAGIYNNLGILSNLMNKDSSSFNFYKKAVEINKKEGNYLKLAINYINLGVDYNNYNHLDQAFNYFNKSLRIVEDNNFIRLYPWVYNNLSDYYIKKGNSENSKEYAIMAYDIAKEHSNKLQELQALEQLKKISIINFDTVQAFYYLSQIYEQSDSLKKYNRLKELDILETRFKFEQQLNIQELEKEKLKTEYYRKELTYVSILLISGLLILLFIIILIWQKGRIKQKTLQQKNTQLEKEKLSKDLEYKNKELTTNVMYLLKKNEFVSSISSKLKNIKTDSLDDYNNAIDRIIQELDRSISNNNWTEFELRFQEVHVGFYNQLSNHYPDLTPNELKICAFLRLNMTSKEISEITFQSPESIKTARYRLRKKLGMERDENLIAFLTKL